MSIIKNQVHSSSITALKKQLARNSSCKSLGLWLFLVLANVLISTAHAQSNEAIKTSSTPSSAPAKAVESKTPASVKKTTAAQHDPKDLGDLKDMEVTKPEPSPFKVKMAIPMWSSAISGKTGVKGRVSNAGYISFTEIYHHLDYVIPGSLSVQYGKFGLLVEGQYTKLTEGLTPRDIIFNAGKIDMKQGFLDINFSYEVVDTENLSLAPFIGTRIQYVGFEGNLSSKFPAIANLNYNASRAWADPILGLQFQYHIWKPIYLLGKADVGGFGAASHLTYEAFGGFKAQITRNLYTDLGYRYLSTDYEDNGFTYDIVFSGPQLTVGWNF